MSERHFISNKTILKQLTNAFIDKSNEIMISDNL